MGKMQTLPIPFGGGLDRLAGATIVDKTAQVDIRNAYLAPGRTELRKGLGSGASVGFGTDIIAEVAVRKTGLLAVVVYDSVSRVVKLYTSDGATFSLVATLWTINVAVAGHLPRVSIADVYDYLFIAHDEQNFAFRNTTKAFDVTNSTVSDLQLNLDRTAPAAVKFRGVARHLSYLIGWGYGTATDPNRPEVLRISMSGDPLNFVPEHYFLVGARGDPIIAGKVLSAEGDKALFVVGKADECYKLLGSSRDNFGVFPMDTNYGFLTSRSAVVVNGEIFAWTLQGPRTSKGGPFGDLALPLDLATGPLPDSSAAPSDDMFAWYDPTNQEVVFCLGSWGYVLHLKDGARRWSYRQYGVTLASASLLLTATGTGSLVPISALIGTVTTTAPSYAPGNDQPTFTVPWTLSGAGTGAESVEVWGRPEIIGTPGHLIIGHWVKLGTFTAAALTGTVTIPYYMTSYDLAVRVVSAGTPGYGFTNTPDSWPASAKATKVSAGAITTFQTTGIWERRSAVEHGFPLQYLGPGCTSQPHPELQFVYEQSTDGGATWHQHAAGHYATPITGSIHQNVDRLLAIRYRLTVVGPSASNGPHTDMAADVTLAPAPPTISLIAADTGELTSPRHIHPILVVAGVHGGPIDVRARHDPDGSWSPTYTVPGGEVDAVALLDNTGGLDHVRVEATTHLTTFEIDDFSVVAAGTASF